VVVRAAEPDAGPSAASGGYAAQIIVIREPGEEDLSGGIAVIEQHVDGMTALDVLEELHVRLPLRSPLRSKRVDGAALATGDRAESSAKGTA
jgi:hypothetical protein